MIRRFTIQSIVVPLAVMVMLTLLVGYTAYQVTQTWEQAINKLTTELVQSQILNNIHSQLLQSHQAQQQGHMEKAVELWGTAKQQVDFLNRNNPSNTLVAPISLSLFLSKPNNIHHIPIILKESYFHANLKKQQTALIELQKNSRRITLLTTASMVILGLLLISATALDLTRLFQELARSRDLNNRIQEEERHRIAQELHDAVIQELIGLKRNYQPDKVDYLVESIRRICHSLKPQVLEDLGFLAGLELLVNDLKTTSPCDVRLNIDSENLSHLPKHYELPLFRIVQELLNNIKQHAEAQKANLTLIYEPEESPLLRLYIQDNGKGFDPHQKTSRLGITGVRERVVQLDGQLKIQSKLGQGSTFQVFIPIRPTVPHSKDNHR